MILSQRTRRGPGTYGERGGSRFNFLLVLLIIGGGIYCAYQYVPVAYSAFLYRDFMQDTINKAAYPPGQPTSWVESQLRAAAVENDLPQNIYINVQKQNGQIVARVHWVKPIQLPGFVYDYKFDHTAKSSSFINPQ